MPAGPFRSPNPGTRALGGHLCTRVCDLLDCRYPVVLAGMGGVARSELVAAITNAGGFGFLGMVREPPSRELGCAEGTRGGHLPRHSRVREVLSNAVRKLLVIAEADQEPMDAVLDHL